MSGFNDLMGNPWFQLGTSILANDGNIGRGLQGGMANLQGVQQQKLLMEMQQLRLKELQAAAAQRAQRQAAMSTLAGAMAPQRREELEGPPMPGEDMHRMVPDPVKQQQMEALFTAFPNVGGQLLANKLLPKTGPVGFHDFQNMSPQEQAALRRFKLLGTAPQQPPDDMRKYQFARSQGYQGSFMDFMAQVKKPLVDMRTQQMPTEQEIARGDMLSRAEDARSFNKNVMQMGFEAQKNIGELDRALHLLETVETGPFQEELHKAKRLGKKMGFEVGDDIASAEELTVLLGNQVMARVGETKGNVSEREMDLFREYSANYGNTPEGNRRILQFKRAQFKRDAELSRMVRAMRKKKKSSLEIQDAVHQYINDNDISHYLRPPGASGAAAPRGDGYSDTSGGWSIREVK